MSPITIEIIGYVASILIIASLAMTSVVRLRILSLLGSIAYIVYGVALGAWPIVIANIIIACLNIWNIYRVLTSTQGLGVSPIAIDAPYLADFLDAHQADIDKFQPGVRPEPGDQAWLFLRDGLPVGALIGRVEGGDFHVKLDYVRPPFRDAKLGAWLFSEGFGQLGLSGVTSIRTNAGTAEHRRYLRGIGFIGDGESVSRAVG
ncbi:MAG: YgjV family protein [Actinobacteria bacterium]|nr:YgjV family protein [Actinomycetota bacterium]